MKSENWTNLIVAEIKYAAVFIATKDDWFHKYAEKLNLEKEGRVFLPKKSERRVFITKTLLRRVNSSKEEQIPILAYTYHGSNRVPDLPPF